jgi:hypothetical protein
MAELTVDTVTMRPRAPLKATWGVLDERELLRVRLDFGDGDFGDGEAAPLELYDGVSLATVRAMATRLVGVASSTRRSKAQSHRPSSLSKAAVRKCSPGMNMTT